MQTAVKVSLGPHRQTKDIQRLSCLLTCWCKSRKPVVMSSRGVQTTQRRLNPPRRQMRKERQEKRAFDATLLSDFFICSSLISVWPKESDNEPPGLQEDRGKSLSHIEPRLCKSHSQNSPYESFTEVRSSQMLQAVAADTRCHFWLYWKDGKWGSFFYNAAKGWSRWEPSLLFQVFKSDCNTPL